MRGSFSSGINQHRFSRRIMKNSFALFWFFVAVSLTRTSTVATVRSSNFQYVANRGSIVLASRGAVVGLKELVLTVRRAVRDLAGEVIFRGSGADIGFEDLAGEYVRRADAQPGPAVLANAANQIVPKPSNDQDTDQLPNKSVSGTRPYIDVTVYGAKGDGTTDDTIAIQKAIGIACVGNGGIGGGIYFPPGYYVIRQKQKPTEVTVPDLSIPSKCSGLYFYGGNNSNRGSWPQFAVAPQAVIRVDPGPRPNGSPIFLLEQGSGATQGGFQSRFENLVLNGYNEAIWILSAVNVRMKNVALSVIATGLPDNTPLKITDTFWFYFTDGTLQAGSNANPVAIFTGENYPFKTSPSVGLVTFRDVITTGGPFFYEQRFPTANAPGNFTFDNVSQEQGGGALPFLRVEGGKFCNGFGPLTIVGSGISDNNPGTPFLELSGCNIWNDITLINDSASTGGHAIKLNSGTIENCTITGGWTTGHNAVDASGLPVPGCGNSNPVGGWDVTGPSIYGLNYQTQYTETGNLGRFNGIPFRAGRSGDLNASLGLDSVMGLLGGPGGNTGGWDTSFAHTGAQEQSLSIARANPPASPTITTTSGGLLKVDRFSITSITNWEGSTEQVFCAASCPAIVGQSVTISDNTHPSFNSTVKVLSVESTQLWSFISSSPGNGTGGSMAASYFYVIEANLTDTSCLSDTETGPSAEISATPNGLNRTAKLTWTPSTGSGIAGYCVWRGTTPGGENVYFYVPGAGSMSFSDRGEAGIPGTPSRINNTFPKKSQYVFGLQGQGFVGTNMVGHVTLSGGRRTIEFNPAWKSAPVCVTNDQTSAGVSKAIPTAEALTIVGGPVDIIDYICFGNPQ